MHKRSIFKAGFWGERAGLPPLFDFFPIQGVVDPPGQGLRADGLHEEPGDAVVPDRLLGHGLAVSKALFGGKEIPCLWRGELEASMDFVLENEIRPPEE